MEQQSDEILYETTTPTIARIVLNRPELRNAQDTRLLYALNAAFDRAAADPEVKVIQLAANGPHFSSGHDLREKNNRANVARESTVGTWRNFEAPGQEGSFAREMEVYLGFCERWRNLPKPTIAEVHGKCIAGGLMLVWPCDLIVASDDALFQDNTVLMGINGVEYFVHPLELGTRKAKEMLFTSDWITAQEAHRLGMVNHVVQRAELSSFAHALAQRIASKPAFALALAKRSVNLAEDLGGRTSLIQAAFGMHHLLHSNAMQLFGQSVDPTGLHQSVRKHREKT